MKAKTTAQFAGGIILGGLLVLSLGVFSRPALVFAQYHVGDACLNDTECVSTAGLTLYCDEQSGACRENLCVGKPACSFAYVCNIANGLCEPDRIVRDYNSCMAYGVREAQTCCGQWPVSCPESVKNANITEPPDVSSPPAAPDLPGAITPAGPQPLPANTPMVCPGGLQYANGVCLPPNPYEGKPGVAGASTLVGLIAIVLKSLLFLGGIAAVIFIMIGGFWYMTSAGNEEQSEKGKKALIDAVIGLAVVILAYVIVSVITTTLTGGVANTAGQTPNPIDARMR